jgi:MinD-like ATPase involved in chromosome partitioning or flagellar assembly
MNAEKKNKRVVFTMGGKGGVGKTGLMVALAEWFEANEIPCTLLDLDTENKSRGSLKHFFNGSVAKVNIHTHAGLDVFVDHLESGAPIILADMGAGSGQVASDWFDAMYEDVSATGARFTAVGVVTPDPASVESVLAWANRLQERAQYLIVQNASSPQADFSYWDSAEQAVRFREALSPIVIRMEFRLAELENPARQHGIRLGQVATRQNAMLSAGAELSQMRTVKVPTITKESASADFNPLLVAGGKAEKVSFFRGSDLLRDATDSLAKARFEEPFPTNSTARLLRRGILSCSSYTGCSFVFYPLSVAASAN